MLKKALFLGSLVVLSIGCDNTLDVTAEWKDIPVVFGVLSPQDTAHYIRIEKAFLDPSRSALEVARIPDSLYYDNLDAALVDLSSGLRYTLEEVDGTEEGLIREEGVFAEMPNILYKVDAQEIDLKPTLKYRLEINRSERLPLVTAETEIVSRPAINRPFFGELLRFQYNQQFKVIWMQSENAFLYDVRLTFNYLESSPATGDQFVPKSLIWTIGRNVTINEVAVDGIGLYEYLAAELEFDPQIERIAVGMDLEVIAGGEEVFEFRKIQLANTGITSVGGDIPRYSNLSEGIGILTSSNRDLKTGYELHPQTMDSLRNGVITEELNF